MPLRARTDDDDDDDDDDGGNEDEDEVPGVPPAREARRKEPTIAIIAGFSLTVRHRSSLLKLETGQVCLSRCSLEVSFYRSLATLSVFEVSPCPSPLARARFSNSGPLDTGSAADRAGPPAKDRFLTPRCSSGGAQAGRAEKRTARRRAGAPIAVEASSRPTSRPGRAVHPPCCGAMAQRSIDFPRRFFAYRKGGGSTALIGDGGRLVFRAQTRINRRQAKRRFNARFRVASPSSLSHDARRKRIEEQENDGRGICSEQRRETHDDWTVEIREGGGRRNHVSQMMAMFAYH